MNTLPLLTISAPLLLATASAQTLLIQEDFNTNQPTNTPSVTWTTTDVPYDNSPNPYEIYGAGGAMSQQMSPGYDHDNDPSTSTIAIPGALEINGERPDVTLTATITLPASLDTSTSAATLSFFAGTRTGFGESPTIAITTQSAAPLIAEQPILTPSNSTTWEFFTYPIDLSTTTPGETLTIDWTGGGDVSDLESLATGSGLQLTDIRFTTQPLQPVPEPSTLLLASLALATTLRRTRRKS